MLATNRSAAIHSPYVLVAAIRMKTLTDSQLTGELGETVVKSKILELGHVFEGRGRLETGIDGTIEFRDPSTRSMTGLTVAVQVKTTRSAKYGSNTAFVSRI